jgi:hypothetical protein
MTPGLADHGTFSGCGLRPTTLPVWMISSEAGYLSSNKASQANPRTSAISGARRSDPNGGRGHERPSMIRITSSRW